MLQILKHVVISQLCKLYTIVDDYDIAANRVTFWGRMIQLSLTKCIASQMMPIMVVIQFDIMSI